MLTVNEYFDGKVKSIGFEGESLPTTVGVISPGEYQFDTSQLETMTVVCGVMDVLLPGHSEWKSYTQGEHFEIDANTSFKVRTSIDTAYLCTYA